MYNIGTVRSTRRGRSKVRLSKLMHIDHSGKNIPLKKDPKIKFVQLLATANFKATTT